MEPKRLNAISTLTVRVPGSTSNLGPGFDCLGLALDLFNDFTVRPLAEGPSRLSGRGTCASLTGTDNSFFAALEQVCRMAGKTPPPVEVLVEGAVPMGAGLGSSASAAVAGALAANTLLGSPFKQESLIAPITQVEGHPDNAAPCLLGGLTVSAQTKAGPLVHVYEPAENWRLALLVPDYRLPTAEARRMLPAQVPLEDAVFNLQRVPFVIDALVAGDADELARIMEDRLHESYRARRIKRHKRIREAAREAGAAATFISGSGPTLAAICRDERTARRVLKAMLAEVADAPFKAQGLVLSPEPEGALVVEGD